MGYSSIAKGCKCGFGDTCISVQTVNLPDGHSYSESNIVSIDVQGSRCGPLDVASHPVLYISLFQSSRDGIIACVCVISRRTQIDMFTSGSLLLQDDDTLRLRSQLRYPLPSCIFAPDGLFASSFRVFVTYSGAVRHPRSASSHTGRTGRHRGGGIECRGSSARAGRGVTLGPRIYKDRSVRIGLNAKVLMVGRTWIRTFVQWVDVRRLDDTRTVLYDASGLIEVARSVFATSEIGASTGTDFVRRRVCHLEMQYSYVSTELTCRTR